MKTRFRLYRRRRGGRYYIHDALTGKQESLQTSDRLAAIRLLHAKNEAVLQSAMNLQIAQVYLQHSDSALSSRTWQHVMEQIISTKNGPTRERWDYAIKDKAFDSIRNRELIKTSPEHFLDVLNKGSVSTNVFLRRAHNYAIGMHWLPWPVLPKLHWPPLKFKEKRAITLEEHQKIIDREHNPATRAYCQLLWHLGGSQTDIATLTADDIDWNDRTIAYQRHKTGVTSLISFGETVAAILETLPQSGYLFPALARIHERHRSKLSIKRLADMKQSAWCPTWRLGNIRRIIHPISAQLPGSVRAIPHDSPALICAEVRNFPRSVHVLSTITICPRVFRCHEHSTATSNQRPVRDHKFAMANPIPRPGIESKPFADWPQTEHILDISTF